MADPEPKAEESAADRMTFLQHLDELRVRLIRAVIAVAVAFVGSFFFYEEIFNFLMQPLRDVLAPRGGELIATAPTEIFYLGMKMSLLVAILISTPAWLGQVWGFVAPGLYKHERRLVTPLAALGSVFFLLGAVFGHTILFPAATDFLSGFGGGGEGIELRYTVSEAFRFYARVVLGSAIVFQIPTLALMLSRVGLVTPGLLWRKFRFAVLGAFVLAALLTPPDPTTQIILAGPIITLYLFSIGIAWIGMRLRAKRSADTES